MTALPTITPVGNSSPGGLSLIQHPLGQLAAGRCAAGDVNGTVESVNSSEAA